MRKLLSLALLILFSCHKGNPDTKSLNASSFPLAIGDSWTYQVTNYPATQTDTAVFQIVNKMVVNNDSTIYTTQTTIHGLAVDSGTIVQTSTGCSYHGDNGVQTYSGSGLFDGWALNFPMQANSSWASERVVNSGQTMSILGRSYSNVFVIAQTEITPGGEVIDTLYVAPGIGILKWYNTQLISYQVH